MTAPGRGGWGARLVMAALLVAGLVIVCVPDTLAQQGPVGSASGFESSDGNLSVESTFDWNGFSPVTWTGSNPLYQSASKTASGWQFIGLTDATSANHNQDTIIGSGGVNQDTDCPPVINGNANNSTDLKRIYVSHKSVNGHLYLNLAWERIRQNNTSANANIGFEFNQGQNGPCSTGSLVHRTVG